MDTGGEEQAARGPAGDTCVKSLVTDADTVQEMLHHTESTLDQIRVSKADDEISSVPPSCCLSSFRVSEVTVVAVSS